MKILITILSIIFCSENMGMIANLFKDGQAKDRAKDLVASVVVVKAYRILSNSTFNDVNDIVDRIKRHADPIDDKILNYFIRTTRERFEFSKNCTELSAKLSKVLPIGTLALSLLINKKYNIKYPITMGGSIALIPSVIGLLTCKITARSIQQLLDNPDYTNEFFGTVIDNGVPMITTME